MLRIVLYPNQARNADEVTIWENDGSPGNVWALRETGDRAVPYIASRRAPQPPRPTDPFVSKTNTTIGEGTC